MEKDKEDKESTECFLDKDKELSRKQKKLERERRVREGGEENYPAVAGRGLQGRAQPGRASAMEAEGGSQGMGCQGRRSGHSYAGQFQQTCHASYPSGSLFLRKPHCSNH